jgi:hypothetical protein
MRFGREHFFGWDYTIPQNLLIQVVLKNKKNFDGVDKDHQLKTKSFPVHLVLSGFETVSQSLRMTTSVM